MKYFLRAMETAAAVSQWILVAAADGKITPEEMVQFVTTVARIWKIDVVVELPSSMKMDTDLPVTVRALPDTE